MQIKSGRRSNRQRTEATRAALLEAARELFITLGYAETSTPRIAASAQVTRGALYHHYRDKQSLFRAVVERESAAVAEEIEYATSAPMPPGEALIRGGEAFLEAMALPGRTRLLLLDGPAVLGRDVMDAIDDAHAAATLREGIAAAMAEGAMHKTSATALAAILAAGFDRAALAIESGGDGKTYKHALAVLINGLLIERERDN
jgi:AcrR family transcriptional regulator